MGIYRKVVVGLVVIGDFYPVIEIEARTVDYIDGTATDCDSQIFAIAIDGEIDGIITCPLKS